MAKSKEGQRVVQTGFGTEPKNLSSSFAGKYPVKTHNKEPGEPYIEGAYARDWIGRSEYHQDNENKVSTMR